MNGRKGSNELAIFFVLLGCILVGLVLSLMVFYNFNYTAEKVVKVAPQEPVYIVQGQAEDPLYYESLYSQQFNTQRGTSHSSNNDRTSSVEDGIVAYFSFDEGANSTRFENDENNREARCSGSECPQSGVSGRHNNGLLFDGVNDLVTIPATSSLSFDKAFSVAFWFKGTKNEAGQFFIGTWDGKDGVSWQADIAKGGKCSGIDLYVSEDGTSGNNDHRAYTRQCNEFYQDGQWHLFVGTFEPGKQNLYIDGNRVGDTTGNINKIDGVFESHLPIRIGSGFGNFAEMAHFQGSFDELRLWDRALTADEVDDLQDL